MAPPMTCLVDRSGNFNAKSERDLKLAGEKNCRFSAVSIIGVQSSGKSTLLNKCFSTNFQEMDKEEGINQTTKGIWIAKGPSLDDGTRTRILLIDTEGSDGSEREQEGNDSFERKSAAFALAMSNTVIVNMKCESVGLHNGASWPLLKTVFQVMLENFTSSSSAPPKVNLMFVLRDHNGSPLEILERQLREGLNKIWQGISSSEANGNATPENYFNVVVMTMSHYVYQRETFDKEVESVRKRLFRLVKDDQLFDAATFLELAKKNWDDIMKNKILDVNLKKITVDKVRCLENMEEKRKNFLQDKDWVKTKGDVASGTMVQGFGKHVNSIMGKYLSQYDAETPYTDSKTRNDIKLQLTETLSMVVEPSYLALVAKMRAETLEIFLKEIVEEIRSRGKFENINSEYFFNEFRDNRLRDAHVEVASWNHTSSQLEKLQSELNSYKQEARRVMEELTALEKSKGTLWVESLKALGFLAGSAAAIAAPPIVPVVGIAALAIGVAVPLPAISIASIVQAFVEFVETKKQIEKDRDGSEVADNIHKRLEKSTRDKKDSK